MMRARTLHIWRVVHRWTSLICSANLLVLCLTGLVLVFHHEIDEALGEHIDTSAPAGEQRLPAETLAEIANKVDTTRRPSMVSFAPDDPAEVYIRLDRPGVNDPADGRWVVLNGYTGAAQALKQPTQTFTGFVLKLHMDLFAGFFGQMFVGAIGVLFIVCTISGLVVYGPYMVRLAFGILRFGRHVRIVNTDLHNLFGVAALVWCLIVGLTGTILSFSPLIVGLWQKTELAAMVARHNEPFTGPAVSVDRAIDAGMAAFPGKDLAFVAFPGSEYTSQRHFSVMVRGHTELTKRLLSVAMVDAETGVVAETADTPWYIKAVLLSGPFHFGDYGGLPLKILWALFTLATTLVTVTGFVIWLKRPRKARQPVAGSQRTNSQGAGA